MGRTYQHEDEGGAERVTSTRAFVPEIAVAHEIWHVTERLCAEHAA
jgi:hypothetical protein